LSPVEAKSANISFSVLICRAICYTVLLTLMMIVLMCQHRCEATMPFGYAADETAAPPQRPPADVILPRLPQIVLRNVAGIPLDTATSYQQAIAESRQRLAAARLAPSEVPLGPSEWRLPHAPVPSRPDYARVALTTDRLNGQRRRNKKRTWADMVDIMEERSYLVVSAFSQISYR
jgi:hypothetical protein